MAQSASKGKMGHNSIGDLVPMNSKIVGSAKILDTLMRGLIHAGNPAWINGWKVLSAPIDRQDQLGLMAPAHTCVVQLPGTPAVVGVLKMKAGGHCTLFVRLKHSLLEKWASTNDKSGEEKKERRVFVHGPLSVEGSATILNAAHAFCMKKGQVHHPQALALLCSMAMGHWLIPPAADQELPTEFGSLTLIALPPIDTNLEQCLCLLGHKSTFSSPVPLGPGDYDDGDDGDDDDDTPLSSSVVNKDIWGATHGSMLRNECVAKFREAARVFTQHADSSTLTKAVPALDLHAVDAKRALAAICLLVKKAVEDHQNAPKKSDGEAKKPAEKTATKKIPAWKAAAAAEVQASAEAARKAAAADHARYLERQREAATKEPKAKAKAKAKAKSKAKAPAPASDAEHSDAPSDADAATAESTLTSKAELVPSDLSEDGLDSGDEEADKPTSASTSTSKTKPKPKPKPARKRATVAAPGLKRKRSDDNESEEEDNPTHEGSSSDDGDGDETSSEEEDEDEDKQGADDASLVDTSDEDKGSDDDDDDDDDEGDGDGDGDEGEEEKKQPNKLKVVSQKTPSDSMLAAMSDMSGPCCARVLEWQAGWKGASLDPERSTRISKDVELAMNSKTPTALMAAFASLVTNLVDAHTDRFKGESWSVNAADSQRMYALAQQSVAFSTATMERVSTAIDCLEEAREMGKAVLSPFPATVAKASAGGGPSASAP